MKILLIIICGSILGFGGIGAAAYFKEVLFFIPAGMGIMLLLIAAILIGIEKR